MKILIAGAGAVGGFYGGALARAGHDVFMIARGKTLAAIETGGVKVQTPEGEYGVRVGCGVDGGSFGIADLVIVCFKSYDTQSTRELYAGNVGAGTIIISLQNGIDNERIIAERFGEDKVLGALTYIGARCSKPGVVVYTSEARTFIGEFTGQLSDRVKNLESVLKQAGIKCRAVEDITRQMWTKLVWNVGFNALCAITECSAQAAAEFADTREIIRGAMLEWIAVANAWGVEIPVETADKTIANTLKTGEVIPSMLMDKRFGRKMEIEAMNGTVARMGEERGVPTPINRTLTAIVRFWNG